jgi:hypothetical protein
MIYLPTLVSADASGVFHPPSHIPTASEPASPFKYKESDTSVNELPSSSKTPATPPFSPISNWESTPKTPFFESRDVWKGDEMDWRRCHAALKIVKSDGRRLELWRAWIGETESTEADITGIGRMSPSPAASLAVSQVSTVPPSRLHSMDQAKQQRQDSPEKRKRRIQWTGDHEHKHGLGKHKEPKGVSQFLTDEPLTVEDTNASKEYIGRVLHERVSNGN